MSKYNLINGVEVRAGWIVWFESIPLLGGIGETQRLAIRQLFELVGIKDYNVDAILELKDLTPEGHRQFIAPDPKPSMNAAARPQLRIYRPN